MTAAESTGSRTSPLPVISEGLSPHMEDYLEAIYFILQTEPEAHAAKIAEHMNVRRASVTGALRILSEKGLINYQPYKGITLTPQGKIQGEAVAKRHRILQSFIRDILGMEAGAAEEIACKMEHVTNPMFMDRLVEFITFFEQCDEVKLTWNQVGKVHCGKPGELEKCRSCSRFHSSPEGSS